MMSHSSTKDHKETRIEKFITQRFWRRYTAHTWRCPWGSQDGAGREHMAFLGTVDGLLWDSQTKVRWLNSKQKQQGFSKLLRAHKGEEDPGKTSAHKDCWKSYISYIKSYISLYLFVTVCSVLYKLSSRACNFGMGWCQVTEKAMAPHSSTLAWKIPWTEEPGRLQSMGSLRVGHD